MNNGQFEGEFQDAELNCSACGNDFIWTAGEQTFICNLAANGGTNKDGTPIVVREPKRCLMCRKAKKDRMERRMNKSL